MKNNNLKFIVAVVVVLPLLTLGNLASAATCPCPAGAPAGASCWCDNLSTGGTVATINGTVATVNGVVVAPPVANPGAGTYTLAQSVVLTAPGSSSISYTTDGSVPTCSSATYLSPITVSSSQAIEAISCYPGSITSSAASFLYNINNTPVAPANSSGGGGGGGYVPPATPKLGDINNDGTVDILDFSIMMADWGNTGVSLADLNKDGVVDELDFSVLMANWGS